ncbi:MFS transporter [Kordiimonas gwangyangensis]|uniref:MFS transporter n=1 Tax=Kordiimonas gwangyangensis TaxID=288022 RepID=UPI000361F409|nr:MFS transporter [Kordiimonas gwangyangensis]
MTTKPQLGFWQIWNMCFGFMGIQFGFALQNANVSRIFQTLGASFDDIPMLWVAAPLTGLIVQPIIGYMSDRTWTRLGRRRPYFLWGAILATLSLFIMPNSPALWVAAGMLWIMDASINVTMEPFRAFVGDNLAENQRTTGFAMQSFFIGVGSVVASALPYMMSNWFGVENTAPEGMIPPSVKLSFYFGGAVLLLAVLWTVFRSKEYSPKELEEFAKAEAAALPAAALMRSSNDRPAASYRTAGIIWFIVGAAFSYFVYARGLDKQLFILSGGITAFGVLQLAAGALKGANRTENAFIEVIDDIFLMPKVMKQLAVVQFFSWFALFAMWTSATPAVTSFHYGSSDVMSKAYNEGADWVGILFAAYNVFAALAAFAIPKLAEKIGRRQTHLLNLCLGGIGLVSFYLISDPQMLILSMVGVGIAWASILSVPYSLLSSAVPFAKMGVYMGIFNFFIVIPQLLAASVLGLLVRVFFDGEPIFAMMIGGISMIIAGFTTLLVDKGETQNA